MNNKSTTSIANLSIMNVIFYCLLFIFIFLAYVNDVYYLVPLVAVLIGVLLNIYNRLIKKNGAVVEQPQIRHQILSIFNCCLGVP
jgi:lipoprotein signal peptidase